MDINENLQQVTTFTGGMNTDTSDSLIGNDQYRMARNVRLTTNTDNNTGELHAIEGTQITNIISEDGEQILALTSIKNYGIVITQDSQGNWYIYRFDGSNAYAGRELFFGPCETPIATKGNKLSVVTRYESDEIMKLYIADGVHEIMMINVGGDAPKTPHTEIEYLTGYTSAILSPTTIKISAASGQLYPAKVQYCYRLYSSHGFTTKLSCLSKPLSIYKTENSGYSNVERSGRAVDITIPDVNTYKANTSKTLDNIQVFRITYRENGQQPQVSLVFDQQYNIGETLTDTGNIDIQTVGISEFLSYIQLKIIPKVLESKNNYLFAGNVNYKQKEIDDKFKDVDVTVQSNFNSDGIALTKGGYFQFNLGYGEQYWLKLDNSGRNIGNSYLCFRPGETYRFGVILYDEDGNASSVKHMCDLNIPDYYFAKQGKFFYNDVINPMIGGIKIDQPTLRVELKKHIPNCSKFEIVRCIRTINDKRTITQGIVGRPLEPKKKKQTEQSSALQYTGKLCPSGFMTLDQIVATDDDVVGGSGSGYTIYANPCMDVLQFASPEYSYQPDDIEDLLNQNIGNLKIQEIENYQCPILKDKYTDVEVYSDYGQYKKNNVKYYTQNGDIIDTLLEINDKTYISANNKNSFKFWLRYNSETKHSYLFFKPFISNFNRNHGYDDQPFGNLIKFERNGNTGYIAFNYLYPYTKRETYKFEKKITNLAFPKVPEYNTLATGETIRFQDDITTIGNRQYVGWSAPCILDANVGSSSTIYDRWKSGNAYDWRNNPNFAGSFYPIGTTGKCILLELDSNIQARWCDDYTSKGFTITVADIKKPAVPYGGTSKSALQNSVYYSYGEVFNNNQYPEDLHITTSSKLSCGDCYIQLFDYAALHNWYDTTFVQPVKMGTMYTVPLYTDIDIRAQFGHKFNMDTNKSYYIQDTACAFDDYVQTKNLYMYNTAYNANPDVIGYTTEEKNKKDTNQYTTRVHYSEQKTNGENYDNWLQFKSLNFLDVDSRYGDITELKLFKDKLIFWQDNATGILAVNERVILQDAQATQVVLGTGAVLDRYDYISTIFGMKPNQNVAASSNEALYWWDGYRKEILQYVDKYSINTLSTAKYIKNYLNQSTECDRPYVMYDDKYKEVIFGCIYNYNNPYLRPESIVYNESIQKFISVYDFLPFFSVQINDKLYIANQSKIYTRKESNGSSTDLFVTNVFPSITYVVNKNSGYTKTFDTQMFDGEFDDINNIKLKYKTSLKQISRFDLQENHEGYNKISDREGDYRINIPRNNNSAYGDRMRGKTMECEFKSSSNSSKFSLKYIVTKYRISCS